MNTSGYLRENRPFVFPDPLRKGDKIAIVSPASVVKEEYVKGACSLIRGKGYDPLIMPSTIGKTKGSYAADDENRLRDLLNALADPQVRAVLCARGGYGCVHLLEGISKSAIIDDPKWIIGFSDVSALLALWNKAGVGAIHGPMAKHLATELPDDLCTEALFNILENGGGFDYMFPSSPMNNPGEAEGVLRGGNLAVLNNLAGTPWDTFDVKKEEDVILFFEDVSEPIYAVERMLYRLYYSGALMRAKGLIFGQFTNYYPDKNFDSMQEMIKDFIKKKEIKDIPVVYDFPVGHVSLNYPLTVGARVKLKVSKTEVSIYSF